MICAAKKAEMDARTKCKVCKQPVYAPNADTHPQCAAEWNSFVQANAILEQRAAAARLAREEKLKRRSGIPGKKKCPKCEKIYGMRQRVCECGYEFYNTPK
jgi:hypothetical protein